MFPMQYAKRTIKRMKKEKGNFLPQDLSGEKRYAVDKRRKLSKKLE